MEPRDKHEHPNFRRLQKEVDRMFLELMGTDRMVRRGYSAFRPNVDVYYCKSETAMMVRLELGGVDPDSVELEVEERVLRIRGHRIDHGHRDKVYHQMEIAYGPFERRVLLPVEVDPSRATAHYHHGFLEISLPITERGGTRRIEIVNKDADGDLGTDIAADAGADSTTSDERAEQAADPEGDR